MPVVLWIDNDRVYLESVVAMFGDRCSLVTGACVQDCIDRLGEYEEEVAVVVTDVHMPLGANDPPGALGGIAAARAVRDHEAMLGLRGQIPVVAVTGFNLTPEDIDSLDQLDTEVIRKTQPGWEEMVQATIDEAIETWSLLHAPVVQPDPPGSGGQGPESPTQILGRIRVDLIKVTKDLEDLESRLDGRE